MLTDNWGNDKCPLSNFAIISKIISRVISISLPLFPHLSVSVSLSLFCVLVLSVVTTLFYQEASLIKMLWITNRVICDKNVRNISTGELGFFLLAHPPVLLRKCLIGFICRNPKNITKKKLQFSFNDDGSLLSFEDAEDFALQNSNRHVDTDRNAKA